MKAIVFGANGFIGSHVVEQLILSGHEVTAIMRNSTSSEFLENLGVNILHTDFNDLSKLKDKISQGTIIYNCIAYRGLQKDMESYREVEVELTRNIIEFAHQTNVKRYIQLSSIIIYGNQLPDYAIDEHFTPNPELIIDKSGLEREQIVRKFGKELDMDFVILQPASTIGRRDKASFFYRIYNSHLKNKFPLIGGGKAIFSCVDTRDIGRAMVFLGETEKEVKGETYLLKGYETTWAELKATIDNERGIKARSVNFSKVFALIIGTLLEKIMTNPPLDRRSVYALSSTRIFNDSKIRNIGFSSKYSLSETVNEALRDYAEKDI